MIGYIIGCVLSISVGIVIGARGYYLYANRMYMKYPEFFMRRLELKIQKKRRGGEL